VMSTPNGKEDGWLAWSKYVLKELETLDKRLTQINDKLDKVILGHHTLKTEMQIKAGVWGAIAGMVPVIVFVLAKAM